jgi:SPX domain protein involved in polyphosphate accumulation
MREASHIAGCFSSRVRHLLHLHVARGIQRYKLRLRQCFKNDQQTMAEEGRMLIEYVTMNAIAIRKILKKYDKVCTNSVHFYLLIFLLGLLSYIKDKTYRDFLNFNFRYIALLMGTISNPRCRLNI